MKNRFFTIRLINLALILALICAYQYVALGRASQEAQAAAAAQSYAAEQAAASGAETVYNDGTYTGSAQGYGGTITLEITIKNDVITEIVPLHHSGEGAAYWDMACSMLSQIKDTQNPNVDTVSGATFTSTGIHNAVISALQSALRR